MNIVGKRLSNTGAQTPPAEHDCLSTTALLDWLAFTLHPADMVATVRCMSDTLAPGADWQAKTLYGYRQGMHYGHIHILWDEENRSRGVHVELSGSGCRELEYLRPDLDWPALFEQLRDMGAKFSRIDIALDDRAGWLTIDRVQAAFHAGEAVSRLHRFSPIEEFNDGGERVAHGFNCGTRKSDTSICFYDKALEQGVPGHWVRCELRLRDKRANALVEAIANSGFGVVSGVLRSALDFKKLDAATRRERCPSQNWWLGFLSNAEKMKLSIAPSNGSAEADLNYTKQIGTLLARVKEKYGIDAIHAAITSGQERLTRRRERVFEKL